MGVLIKDKYRVNCLIALRNGFANTSSIRFKVNFKVAGNVKQEHVLSNLKQLEKDGYVKRKMDYCISDGHYWELTKLGVEYLSKLKAGK